MVKRLLMGMVLALCMCLTVQAAGLTVWGLAENENDFITARVGYDLSVGDQGGLEPFIGSVWPGTGSPQVIVLGAVQHMPDLIDPNSPVPFLPDLFLTVISEDVQIRPYIGGQFSVNLVDEDAGTYGMIAGITIQISPEANSQLVFEASYDKNFGDLADVPDNEVLIKMGFRIPF